MIDWKAIEARAARARFTSDPSDDELLEAESASSPASPARSTDGLRLYLDVDRGADPAEQPPVLPGAPGRAS